jgi:glycosyltransferase involved in cell wall biosynthesis
MLTVLHTESSNAWGGQENRSLRESKELIKRGHRAMIVCQPGSGIAKYASEVGVPVATVPMPSSYDPAAVNFIRNLIRKEGIDIVNTHSSKDSWLASVAAWLSLKKPALVRTRHLAIGIKKSLTYTLLPRRIVTVSEYVRQLFLARGLPADKVVTIPSGIDTEKFDPSRGDRSLREKLGIGPTVPVVVMIAILRLDKGHYYFVHAAKEVAKKFPEVKFLIVGDGPQKENIMGYIDELNVNDNVLMLGLRRDIPEVLSIADLYVIPSIQEGMGQSTMEAMAMGVPVIASSVGGLPELVVDNETGLLVPPRDISALARAMEELLSDKEKSGRLRDAARGSILRNYTIEKTVDRTLELYAGIL